MKGKSQQEEPHLEGDRQHLRHLLVSPGHGSPPGRRVGQDLCLSGRGKLRQNFSIKPPDFRGATLIQGTRRKGHHRPNPSRLPYHPDPRDVSYSQWSRLSMCAQGGSTALMGDAEEVRQGRVDHATGRRQVISATTTAVPRCAYGGRVTTIASRYRAKFFRSLRLRDNIAKSMCPS